MNDWNDETVARLLHDLRNRLSSSKLLLEMLLKGMAGNLNEKQKDMIKDIDTSNESMVEMLKKYE